MGNDEGKLSIEKLKEIQSCLIGSKVDGLVDASRYFVTRFECFQILSFERGADQQKHDRSCFLFNNLLLLTKTSYGKRLQYKAHFKLFDMEVRNVPNSSDWKNMVILCTNQELLAILSFENPHIKQIFIESLQEQIELERQQECARKEKARKETFQKVIQAKMEIEKVYTRNDKKYQIQMIF